MASSEEQSLTARLQLRLHATRLPRVGLTKTPPSTFAHVTFVGGPFSKDQEPEEWGCTEVIRKYCHPQWTEVLTTDYEYGKERFFFVRVLRHHKNAPDSPTLIGSALFEISDIMGTATHTRVKRLPEGGCLFAQMEPVVMEKGGGVFRFQMRAMDLKPRGSGRMAEAAGNLPWNNGPDTVLEVSKQRVSSTGNSWVAVYRSGPVYNSLIPTWDEAEIDLETCCQGKITWPIRLSIWNYRKGHADALLGVCETTVEKLMRACIPDESIEEISEKDLILTKINNPTKEVGTIRVLKAELHSADEIAQAFEPPQSNGSIGDVANESFSSAPCEILLPPMIQDAPQQTRPRFKQYVDNGCEIDLCFAIDFTSSNGDPRIPGTLHYQAADSLNDYEEAISAIGDALSLFNSTKEYPVWGFGAKFAGVIRHIFQCGPSSTVQGVDGVLQAYSTVFHSDLTMSGPTVFSQVIQAAAIRARKYHETMNICRRYCVLLIITDGMVDDLAESQRKLQVYRDMPLSVVIVGVGRAEFKGMKALCHQGLPTTFVEFRKHQSDPSSMAKAALEDLPRHIVEYMTANEIDS